MSKQHDNYYIVAKAINYLKIHFRDQPSLDDVANAVNLSPFYLQRLFSEWAGVSPKKFIQFLSVEYAKQRLQDGSMSVLETAYDTGLSSAGRLHDLFVKIEGMTPGEYKNGGEKLTINYSFSNSRFGKIMVASTAKGVCHIAFEEHDEEAVSNLKKRFPNAIVQYCFDPLQELALAVFKRGWNKPSEIKLHLQGTPFQLKVWQCLLDIPVGELTTYSDISTRIGNSKAVRAVGTAIGNNPIAFVIPCHRVIRSSGELGGYRWGEERKAAMVAWEASSVVHWLEQEEKEV